MTTLVSIMLAALLQSAPGPLETVARDAMSGVVEPRQAVARSDAEWSALWREHAGAKPAPRVDFTTKMVVAVFLGSRPSAGYAVEIVETRADGAGLVVRWSERSPSPDAMTAQVITAPAHFVALPKVPGPIRFEKAAQ